MRTQYAVIRQPVILILMESLMPVALLPLQFVNSLTYFKSAETFTPFMS